MKLQSIAQHTIATGSAFDFLPTLADESVDLIITDIPYESLEKHRKVGTTTRLKESEGSSNQWFSVIQNTSIPRLMREMYRVLKPNGHLYFFCDEETTYFAKPAGEMAGFKFWKSLVWVKMTKPNQKQRTDARYPPFTTEDRRRIKFGMGYHYRNSTERIMFFEKGKRKLNFLDVPDVLHCEAVHDGWPTEKPVDLIAVLIEQSASKGEVVLDPFCGSGSIGVAAVNAGCTFIGCDIDPQSAILTKGRLDIAINKTP